MCDYMIQALIDRGVGRNLVKLIRGIYSGLKAQIVTDIEGDGFEINGGIRRGDPISPLLFNRALDKIFRNFKLGGKGSRN